ncbi:hypothetical protein CEXT_452141 [Caerostris extrusa]|uniref:Uncharacterized protein n=1 Tax=Caerostris extrusa TaxID=172846 RepID=A0AAV4T1F3_CAEEX|nr:hypothetical protein CEXT_452141 [Caerostris extrusa]
MCLGRSPSSLMSVGSMNTAEKQRKSLRVISTAASKNELMDWGYLCYGVLMLSCDYGQSVQLKIVPIDIKYRRTPATDSKVHKCGRYSENIAKLTHFRVRIRSLKNTDLHFKHRSVWNAVSSAYFIDKYNVRSWQLATLCSYLSRCHRLRPSDTRRQKTPRKIHEACHSSDSSDSTRNHDVRIHLRHTRHERNACHCQAPGAGGGVAGASDRQVCVLCARARKLTAFAVRSPNRSFAAAVRHVVRGAHPMRAGCARSQPPKLPDGATFEKRSRIARLAAVFACMTISARRNLDGSSRVRR